MSEQARLFYEFGPFRLEVAERRLLRAGEPVSLPPKAFDTLLLLVERRGHVVKKDEIISRLWPDTFVEENNLTQYISLLRKALGDGRDGDRYIETVPRWGYRFADGGGPAAAEVLVQKQTRARILIHEETVEEEDEAATTATAAARTEGGGRPALRRRLALATLCGALALGGLALTPRLIGDRRGVVVERPAARPGISSIAVLPFKPLGVRGDDAYLGLGLADALITKFGRLRQVGVRPTSAVQKYDADTRDPAEIGRELKADVVLDGRYQVAGGRVRVTAQLVNVRDGTLLWTGQFDEPASDLLAVQDSISAQAAEAMRLQLSARERERLPKPATTVPEAYQAYLKGRYFWNKRTPEGLNKGLESFRRAIELDPGYAQAYAGLADCYNLLSEHNAATPRESFAAAEQAARKALELDESLAEAHTSLAYALVNHEWDWADGESEYRRAIELNPSYATAHQWYAEYLAAMGRRDEAAAELERALELDPLSLIINAEQGLAFLAPGGFDRAVEKIRKAVELDPNFPVAHAYLAMAYEFGGNDGQAFEELLTTTRLSGASPAELAAMERAFKCCGLRGVWKRSLAAQLERRRSGYGSPYIIAQTYARLGDEGQALSWLEQAYREHDRYLIGFQSDQAFAAVRPSQRFQELLRRMNLGS